MSNIVKLYCYILYLKYTYIYLAISINLVDLVHIFVFLYIVQKSFLPKSNTHTEFESG